MSDLQPEFLKSDRTHVRGGRKSHDSQPKHLKSVAIFDARIYRDRAGDVALEALRRRRAKSRIYQENALTTNFCGYRSIFSQQRRKVSMIVDRSPGRQRRDFRSRESVVCRL
jgi:hypothetical protein